MVRFHHTGMVAKNIAETYTDLREHSPVEALSDVVYDPEQRVRLQLLDVGGLALELVEDHGAGPAASWLRRGCKLYHICFEVDDLDAHLDSALQRGCIVVSLPKPAVLFHGRRVAFVMDPNLGLLEFLEKGLPGVEG